MLTFFVPSIGDVGLVPTWPHAGAPSSGTSGTLAGYASVGDLLIDTTNAVTYQNTGTQASPTWTQIGGNGTSVSFANVAVTGFVDRSIAAGLTAVGSSRTNALALTAQTNIVSTAASSAVGVVLPASATVGVGGWVDVYNDGPSNAFHVYAAGSDTIDGTAGSTGLDLTDAFWCRYLLASAGAFKSYRSAITRSA